MHYFRMYLKGMQLAEWRSMRRCGACMGHGLRLYIDFASTIEMQERVCCSWPLTLENQASPGTKPPLPDPLGRFGLHVLFSVIWRHLDVDALIQV